MNDLQIYQLMAQTPNIRAVQISDSLDQELTAVSEALRALVDEGDVVRHSGTAPNGQPAQIYNLSETFKKSNDYKAIMNKLASTAPIETASPTEPVAPQAATAAPTVVKTVSHVDNAIAYLKLTGKATNADLKRHMNIGSGSPANYLNAALRDGRLAREGIYWMLGASSSDTNAPETKALDPSEPLRRSLAALHKLILTSPTPKPLPAASPSFRCGLWSDDVLELQRNGVTLATLERAEGEHIADFFNRLPAATESA